MGDDPTRESSQYGMVMACAIMAAILTGGAFIILPALSRVDNRRRLSCANHLKQIGLSLKMYANETPAKRYPSLAAEFGRLSFETTVYPEYFFDPTINLCPDGTSVTNFAVRHREWRFLRETRQWLEWKDGAHEDVNALLDDWDYFYTGFVLMSDEDVQVFADWYMDGRRESTPVDLTYIETTGARRLYPLTESIDTQILHDRGTPITDETSAQIRAQIPIVIERPGNHKDPGAYVLYLDGQVEFIPYPGKWPMTEKTIRILNELDALGSHDTNEP